MNFKKANNIAGWLVFAIALVVYLLTIERTVSFWDCGEFLSTAYKLEVGHSPGAPLFMLLGRMFGMFASPVNVALFINSLSAITSAFTILFLFWTITHFAYKLLMKAGDAMDQPRLVSIIGTGLVGALAYTFSDTFWFSAVEAEVYATSSFFTAIVFWAILKWEHNADSPQSDRWLILISYLMGLSIGVHLLNLLTIPALVMVFYFRKYTPTLRGGILAFVLGCVLLGCVQVGLIQGIPIIASKFELLFVNTFGLPFDSGALFFIALLIGGLTYFIIWSSKKAKRALHTGLLCVVFALIGYSSYISIIIRSRADVPIDMTNPDDVLSLLSYLQREQYGAQPIVMGPDFNSEVIGTKETSPIYVERNLNGKNSYEKIGDRFEYDYASGSMRLFPRLYSAGHANFYQNYLGLSKDEEASASDNMAFFFKYQMNWMWWRYFMWNYAGRQNDFAGSSYGEPENGNWILGIKPVDKLYGRGDMDKMPDYMKNNRAHNEYYALPFILGLLGLVYHFNRKKHDATIVALLFFFTGIAIVIYLNNTPQQPRERDYAYAGATYAFAIWIGLGVLMVSDWLRKVFKSGSVAPGLATLLCLVAVPALMANENWDDHDRSQKTLARSTAYNVLASCDSNAILFTVGDNDTYPLWYMQEIEGYRTDVRVVNLSLLGIDWYIDQLNNKINDADAVPMIWKPADYEGDKRNVVPYVQHQNIPTDKYIGLEEVVRYAISNDASTMVTARGGTRYNAIPTKNVAISFDKEAAVKNKFIAAADTAKATDILFTISKDQLYKSDMAMLNILAANAKEGWKRPIHFSAGFPGGSDFLGLDEYMEMQGLVNKLVPYRTVGSSPSIGRGQMCNLDKSMQLYLDTFLWGGTETKTIYFDEKNKAMMATYRYSGAKLAEALVRDNRKADAVKVLDKLVKNITYESYQYDQSMWGIISAYYEAGAQDKAASIIKIIAKDAEDMLSYILTISDDKSRELATEVDGKMHLGALQFLGQLSMQSGDTTRANQYNKILADKAQALGISLK
jgi:hypothetical protein